MRSMSSLVHKLKNDFPQFIYFETNQFAWTPSSNTLSYAPKLANARPLILHELSHALLGHTEYEKDVQLLTIEAAAWEKAKELATSYRIDIPETVVQDHLDTYRDWMHARSTCPSCEATGYQTTRLQYSCPACTHTWRVNEARLCGLKRYSLTK